MTQHIDDYKAAIEAITAEQRDADEAARVAFDAADALDAARSAAQVAADALTEAKMRVNYDKKRNILLSRKQELEAPNKTLTLLESSELEAILSALGE